MNLNFQASNFNHRAPGAKEAASFANFNFLNIEELPSVFSFTRASSAMVVNKLGLLEFVATDVPRLDNDITTLRPLGLLIELSSTNNLLYSQSFESTWTRQVSASDGAASYTDGQVSPTGDTSAILITRLRGHQLGGGSNSTVLWYNPGIAISPNAPYSVSVYAKLAPGSPSNKISMRLRFSDISSLLSSSYTEYTLETDRWVRLQATAVSPAGASKLIVAFGTGPGTEVPDDISNVYLWGAQAEAQANTTSYIPTAGSAATRAYEYCGYLFPEGEQLKKQGTFLIESEALGSKYGLPPFVAVLYGLSSSQFITISRATATTANFVVADFSTSVNLTATAPSIGYDRYAIAFKENDVTGAHNGVLTTNDTSAVIPAIYGMSLGAGTNPVYGFIDGHISVVQFFDQRIADAQLIDLTS